MKPGKMLAVVGAQYGSEGKGAVVAHIANKYGCHVRVGSPNAGHTIYWNGQKHVMQSVPCGWINPEAKIIIGRGALLNMRQLMKELVHILQYYPDFLSRLYIDATAGILDERFHEQEGGVNGEMHKRIGSTGEGVGPARIARIQRDPNNFKLFHEVADDYGMGRCVYHNTPGLIADTQSAGTDVLLEGTQGSALSLLHSCWPYCTSTDTNVAGILSECGIAPSRLSEVLLVARTFPIRVAGNSGPMNGEITWADLSERVGKKVEEKTTVTKKVRRVAVWDDDLLASAMLYNGNCRIALTFADYVDPSLHGVKDREIVAKSGPLMDFISKHRLQHYIDYIGTGPDSMVEW